MGFLTWLFLALHLIPAYHSTPVYYGGVASSTNPTLTVGIHSTTLKTGVQDILNSWDNGDGTTSYVYNAGTLSTKPQELSHEVDGRNNIVRHYAAPQGKQRIELGEKGYHDDMGWHALGRDKLYTVDFRSDMQASTTIVSLIKRWLFTPAFANNSTFNPAAGANDPVDGSFQAAACATWSSGGTSSARGSDGVGCASNPQTTATVDTQPGARQRAGGTFDDDTAVFCYATGTIGAGATVSSTTQSVFEGTKTTGAGDTAHDWFNTYSASPASNANLVATDYPNRGFTAFSSEFPIANMPNNAYVSWTFNSTGNAAVNVTADSCFTVESGYDASNTPPTAVGATFMQSTWSDNGSNKPILSVTFTPAPAAVKITQPPQIMNFF